VTAVRAVIGSKSVLKFLLFVVSKSPLAFELLKLKEFEGSGLYVTAPVSVSFNS